MTLQHDPLHAAALQAAAAVLEHGEPISHLLSADAEAQLDAELDRLVRTLRLSPAEVEALAREVEAMPR